MCLCCIVVMLWKKIEIGKIVNAVGLKGEVKVYNYSDSADIYMETQYLYAEDEMLEVENVRLQKKRSDSQIRRDK